MIDVQPQDLRFAGWLPAGVGLDDAIAALAALAVAASVLAMWQMLRPKNAFERRLEQVVERKESLRREALAARTRRQHRRPLGWMRAAVTGSICCAAGMPRKPASASPAPGSDRRMR